MNLLPQTTSSSDSLCIYLITFSRPNLTPFFFFLFFFLSFSQSKEDKLSSRIQSMLGNYDEMKEPISDAIPKISGKASNSSTSSSSEDKSGPTALYGGSEQRGIGQGNKWTPVGPAATSSLSQSQKRSGLGSQRSSGGGGSGGSSQRHAGEKKSSKHSAGVEQHTKSHTSSPAKGSSSGSSASSGSSSSTSNSSSSHLRSSMSSTATAVAEQQQHHGKERYRSKSPRDREANWDSPSRLHTTFHSGQHCGQAFPPSLMSKPGSMLQKPTAYVRPMDGQETAEAKSSQADSYSGPPHGATMGEMKANSKASLSKLKIPSQPMEVRM